MLFWVSLSFLIPTFLRREQFSNPSFRVRKESNAPQLTSPAILYAKWATTGLVDNYDRSILFVTIAYQFGMGFGFVKAGAYKPLLAVWLTPFLAGLSQVF